MTVADLIEILNKQPPDAEVWVGTACHGCFEPVDNVTMDSRGMLVIEGGNEE